MSSSPSSAYFNYNVKAELKPERVYVNLRVIQLSLSLTHTQTHIVKHTRTAGFLTVMQGVVALSAPLTPW